MAEAPVMTGTGEDRCGMTVSAFSSVSAEPPTVLVLPGSRARGFSRDAAIERYLELFRQCSAGGMVSPRS